MGIPSPASRTYHSSRRSNANLRHSPSRAAPTETQQFDYLAPSSDNDDKLIDNAAHRYADYNPEYYQTTNTAAYKSRGSSIDNRLDYAHIGENTHMV
jgi:hypothetical protein